SIGARQPFGAQHSVVVGAALAHLSGSDLKPSSALVHLGQLTGDTVAGRTCNQCGERCQPPPAPKRWPEVSNLHFDGPPGGASVIRWAWTWVRRRRCWRRSHRQPGSASVVA